MQPISVDHVGKPAGQLLRTWERATRGLRCSWAAWRLGQASAARSDDHWAGSEGVATHQGHRRRTACMTCSRRRRRFRTMLWVPAGLAGVPAASHGRVLGLPSFRLSRLGHRRANRCVGWTLTLTSDATDCRPADRRSTLRDGVGQRAQSMGSHAAARASRETAGTGAPPPLPRLPGSLASPSSSF